MVKAYKLILTAVVFAVLSLLPTLSSTVSAASTDITVGTFNVLGEQFTRKGRTLANEGWKSGAARLDAAMPILSGKKLDVIGFQEFEAPQHQHFVDEYTRTWGIYPQSPAHYDTKLPRGNAIIWRKSKFKLVGSGERYIKYYGATTIAAPWVKLRQISTGKDFYVTNTHDPVTNESRGNNAKRRVESAKSSLSDVAKKTKTAPVIVLGDFNSAFVWRDPNDEGIKKSDITYCLLTQTKVLTNTYDIAHNKNTIYKETPINKIPPCPTKRVTTGIVDHVYVSDRIDVFNWSRPELMKSKKISDHEPVIVRLTLL